MIKLDLFESKLLVSTDQLIIHYETYHFWHKIMSTSKARKVLRDLSESAIPLLDDDTYRPLAERIIACHGTLLTSTLLEYDDTGSESMDIVTEDATQTHDHAYDNAVENLGLAKLHRSKGISALDLPIGSVGTDEKLIDFFNCQGVLTSFFFCAILDSQRIRNLVSQREEHDDLHPLFLKRILAIGLYDKYTSKTKSVLWTKYPSIFYDEVTFNNTMFMCHIMWPPTAFNIDGLLWHRFITLSKMQLRTSMFARVCSAWSKSSATVRHCFIA